MKTENQTLLAIDPGTTESGWALFGADGSLWDHGISANYRLYHEIPDEPYFRVAIEMIASYGMPVGKEVFETCVWIGRFVEFFVERHCRKVYRRQVKVELCGSPRAKDSNIRQAILDRYPPTGGGKTPQIGTKAQPGPLYGVKSHIFAAIGVGLTARAHWDELETFGDGGADL
tara:strand:+ start:2399 stop:2917 length:519 start_codon:yes stop_codon:yes gene_type:complete